MGIIGLGWLMSVFLSGLFGSDEFTIGQIRTVTFDPPVNPGGIAILDDWEDQSMYFTGPNGFAQYDSGRDRCPDNGTAYLQFTSGPPRTLVFNNVYSIPFTLHSVDLAEYSTFFDEPWTITFTGHKTDGSTVTEQFTVDGVIDGPGPLADFETFFLGGEFTDLSYVEVPTTRYALDNVVVAPASGYETLVDLEITGPNEVLELTDTQYMAIATFEGGLTSNVSLSAQWSVEPNLYASIDGAGCLTIEENEHPVDITLYTRFTYNDTTLTAEKSVHVGCAETVYFMVAEIGMPLHNDSYVLALKDPDDVEHARNLIAYGPAIGKAIVIASIDHWNPNNGINMNRDYLHPGLPAWSWCITEFDRFANMSIEILDGWPSYVEADVESWIRNTDGQIGFWSYTIVTELGADLRPRNCDFDISGSVAIKDLFWFISYWQQADCFHRYWCGGADLDGSGSVDLKDWGYLAGYWLWGQ